jgi:hypothetical protein
MNYVRFLSLTVNTEVLSSQYLWEGEGKKRETKPRINGLIKWQVKT